LSRTEYGNAIRDIFGIEDIIPTRCPLDTVADGFDNYASAANISQWRLDNLFDLAESIAERESSNLESLLGCGPAPSRDCVATFVRDRGRLIFRRALVAEEQARFMGIYDGLVDDTSQREAVEAVIEAFLISPQFLFRPESGHDHASPAPGVSQLTGYELAGRLSFMLWASIPDDALLDAAEEGRLDTAEGLETEARRMLDDPRSQDGIVNFGAQWADLRRLDGISLENEIYPDFGNEMREAMRVESERFIDHVIRQQDGDVGMLLTSTDAFVDYRIAPVYGVEFIPPANARPCTASYHWRDGYVSNDCAADEICMDLPDANGPNCDPYHHGQDCPGLCVPPYQQVALPAHQRAGILTRSGFLTGHSHTRQPSIVERGKFVRNRLLCTDIAPPPPNVEDTVPMNMGGQQRTNRERLAQHTQGACVGCHQMMDPIGYGMENFDSMGAWRDEDTGQPVRADGELLFTGDANTDGPYNGPIELMTRLAESETVQRCMAQQVFRFAHGRRPEPAEPAMAELENRHLASGGSLRELLVSITQTDSFRCRPAVEGN
jgi:hypothetical protein